MKTKVLLALTLLVGFSASAHAAAGTIVGTKHDLSSGTGAANSIYSTTQNQTCVFCHAPHNALVNKLLWNRTNTGATTTMNIYTSYNTGAMRTTLTQNTLGSDSSSLLCLSCHSLASANIANIVTNATGGGTANVGAQTTEWTNRTGVMTDLRNDHPVGINYDAAQGIAGTGLNTSALVAGAQIVNNNAKIRLFKSAVSGTSTMECASCHSVHDNTNTKFLAVANGSSALCIVCHVK